MGGFVKNKIYIKKVLIFLKAYGIIYLVRGISSAGRALHWQCRGQRFDPAMLHQKQSVKSGLFFYAGFKLHKLGIKILLLFLRGKIIITVRNITQNCLYGQKVFKIKNYIVALVIAQLSILILILLVIKNKTSAKSVKV